MQCHKHDRDFLTCLRNSWLLRIVFHDVSPCTLPKSILRFFLKNKRPTNIFVLSLRCIPNIFFRFTIHIIGTNCFRPLWNSVSECLYIYYSRLCDLIGQIYKPQTTEVPLRVPSTVTSGLMYTAKRNQRELKGHFHFYL